MSEINQNTLYYSSTSLYKNETSPIDDYLETLKKHISLPARDTAAILSDVRKLIRFYLDNGMTFQEAIKIIGENPFGDFYRSVTNEWYPLDSAAKVYPLCLTSSSMAVFRLSVYLKNPVIPCVLQFALLSTLRRFPTFATTVRKGFFWHYLDSNRRHFSVREETSMPCLPIIISGTRAPSFRVRYYRKRISLEVFHMLTDGTGALTFLKSLTREYLRLLGTEIPYDIDILNLAEKPDELEFRNDFPLADKVKGAGGLLSAPAAQIKGKRTVMQPSRVLHFKMSSSELRAVSKQYGTTVTGFMIAALFVASAASLKRKKPGSRVQIQVPTNMRTLYPSKTLFNFSMFSLIKLKYEEISSLEAIIPEVEKQLREVTQKSELDKTMTMTNALISNPILRFTPLVLKQLIFQNIINPIKDYNQTNTLSNVGIIKNEFGGQVDSFDGILGPTGVNRAACGMISYEDNAMLTITKSTLDRSFEESLFEVLSAAGIHVEQEEVSIYANR